MTRQSNSPSKWRDIGSDSSSIHHRPRVPILHAAKVRNGDFKILLISIGNAYFIKIPNNILYFLTMKEQIAREFSRYFHHYYFILKQNHICTLDSLREDISINQTALYAIKKGLPSNKRRHTSVSSKASSMPSTVLSPPTPPPSASASPAVWPWEVSGTTDGAPSPAPRSSSSASRTRGSHKRPGPPLSSSGGPGVSTDKGYSNY